MSKQHPIVAVTGSAGAGLSTVRHAFKFIFERLGIKPAIVHGDGFRRYTERQFAALLDEARDSGRRFSWFGPECNHFPELEAFFKTYGECGSGVYRQYAHNPEHAEALGVVSGEFTDWKPLPPGSDLLFYEGQHGGLMANTWTRRKVDSRHFPPEIDRRIGNKGIDVAQHVDLLIGVAPAINLEWIQKIHRDCDKGTCSHEESVETILRRMDDYIHYIVPQFGLTDINIQRMPLVDTSNPFIARDVPVAEESICILHFRDRKRHDFPTLLSRIPGAYMSRPTTMVIPCGKLRLALEVICAPILAEFMDARQETLATA
jgi:phosphoribulokinase